MQRHTPLPAHHDDLSLKIGYLQRILDYAFGAQGDIWVIGQRLKLSEIEQFNHEAEEIDISMYNTSMNTNEHIINMNRHRVR